MVVTVLQANVEESRTEELITQFQAASESLPPAILESFLLHEASSNDWRIVTAWESREALDGYRAAVDTPGGVLMFRSADAEPVLAVFEVEGHADHT